MSTDITLQPLSDLLIPFFPADLPEWGRWAWLAAQFGVARASVTGWLERGVVPARRVDALCDLLKASPELRAELKRRAGIQTLTAVGPTIHAEGL